MIVEHDFCDTLAEDAPSDPENVQLVALFARLGGAVMAGSAESSTGCATAQATMPVRIIELMNFAIAARYWRV